MPIKLKIALYIALLSLILISYFFVAKTLYPTPPEIDIPEYGITNKNIGLLVKKNDPLSIQTAEIYQKARGIPAENIFYLDLPDEANISPEKFILLHQALTEKTGDHIQAFVATWQAPYRVNCMSITSALAFGYDKRWCQARQNECLPTPNSTYFNSNTDNPWNTLKIRPSMLLTGKDISEITSLIQRGVASDATRPKANAYLINTTDAARSARKAIFQKFAENFPKNNLLEIHFLDATNEESNESIAFKRNILVYETGLVNVPYINTNHYLPGAIADHLTSFGGQGLSEEGQMKAFRWLEAGVTGSYGTVVEPCNFVQKYPNPSIFIPRYLRGETLIEAYWKSVQQPSEGLFIGEPLAKPYDLLQVSALGGNLTIVTNRLKSNRRYQLLEWQEVSQEFKNITANFRTSKLGNETIIQAKNTYSKRYRLIEVN